MIELKVAIKNKVYANSKNEVLKALDFSVERGEFVAVIGPSGCGKTTLLNMISGLEASSSQQITHYTNDSNNSSAVMAEQSLINGQSSVHDQSSLNLGYIFQQPRLMPWLSVRENIELVLQPDDYHQVDALLADVGLAGKGEFFPRQLSGGMQRRVSIARAFAVNPQLLLLDEPFNSLDVPTADRLRQLLIALCKQRGTTVVLVTHDLQEAIYLADRIIFLSHSPSVIIHQTVVDLPRPRAVSGMTELAWQAKLMTKFPNLLAGDAETST